MDDLSKFHKIRIGEVRDKYHELTGEKIVTAATDASHDLSRYICYHMLVDCKDSNLAKSFVKLCNGNF